jgi:5-bromo-4-chloroindolyl phosphate hydrolysis protein
MKNLQEIKANLEKLDKEFKQIRADMPESNNDVYYKCMDACYQMVSSLRQYVYGMEDNFYRTMDTHMVGHLPKIAGAEKMSNALETLGISEDYAVQKPTIYVRANRQGNKEFQVELGSTKK